MLALILTISMMSPASRTTANERPSSLVLTIAVDPGHGGYDIGGKGPDEVLEKNVALSVAQALAKALKPDYAVVLTRNGDYRVELTRRASVANNKKANLFISIHAGTGNQHQADVWSVFYYKKSDKNDNIVFPAPEDQTGLENSRFAWDRIQQVHVKQSRVLAGCIKTQLVSNPDIPEVVLTSADLRVLQGLDMPAVVIETGYLTNPKTEKQLQDPDFVADLAERIKKGIDVYLTR